MAGLVERGGQGVQGNADLLLVGGQQGLLADQGDLLVDALPGATLLDLGDLEEELKSLLGVDVDLLTPGDLPPKFRAKVLAEAKPV